ncbi:hypothetical protein ACXGQW_04505 [Wenyingzhuangia sp. IMCC45533]
MKLKLITYYFCFFVFSSLNTWSQTKERAFEYSERTFPERYKDNYTSKDYVYEVQEPSFMIQLKKWLLDALIRLLNNIGVSSPNLKYFSTFFYIVIALIAIYIIVKMILKNESQWIFRKKRKDNSLIYETEIENIEKANFSELVRSSVTNKDFRLATKYYYLWVLQKLSERGLIELNNLKTNADYQLEIEDSQHITLFKSVSYYYNYVWYGEFAIDETSFDKIKETYAQLLKDLDL